MIHFTKGTSDCKEGDVAGSGRFDSHVSLVFSKNELKRRLSNPRWFFLNTAFVGILSDQASSFEFKNSFKETFPSFVFHSSGPEADLPMIMAHAALELSKT